MYRTIVLGLFLCCLQSVVDAQDRFFTQFYSHALSLNPALTGTMNGTFRVNAALRQQYASVLSTPYSTFSAAADMGFKISSNYSNADRIGVGIFFTHDQFGEYDFNANAISLTAAYHKDLSSAFEQSISFGFLLGIEQRATGYNNLVFEDQFLLGSGYILPTGEDLPRNQLAFMDMALGVNYSMRFADAHQLYAGLSIWHFNQPNISFYAQVDPQGSPLEISASLATRYTAHMGLNLRLSENTLLSPRVITTIQADHKAVQAGINYRFDFDDVASSSFHIGAATRVVDQADNLGLDAIILMVAFGREHYKLGLSYDAQVNDLQNERNGQGAYEITLTLTGNYEAEQLFCPEF